AALIAGLAFGATRLTDHTAANLYAPAILVLGIRVATAEQTELRRRVLHAGAVSLLVSATVASFVTIFAPLPHSTDLLHGLGITRVEESAHTSAVPQEDSFGERHGPTRVVLVALPLLLLLTMRPWRRERRYTDFVLAALAAWSLIALGSTSS